MAAQRTPGVVDQLRALDAAAEACRGRVPGDAVEEALRVVRRAGQRLRRSGGSTVVALGGATGSGKSTLVNALAGVQVSTPGLRRPTTSAPVAVSWGEEPPEDLLDWLQVTRRHQRPATGDDAGLAGLVLLDLPDHDSIAVGHRIEVDRLVELVDMFVWVVDPQKYADAALHTEYLRPMRDLAPLMVVVLNQIDRLGAADRQRTTQDLRTLLDREGLDRVPLCATSALTGEGLAELRRLLADRVGAKQAMVDRLRVDVRTAAERLDTGTGSAATPELGTGEIAALDHACARAAGVPAVTEAVGRSWRRRGRVATGWPLLAWIAALRPDPLRRLHLDPIPRSRRRREIEAGVDGRYAPTHVQATSLAPARGVPAAQVDGALRDLGATASGGMPTGWADAVRAAARSRAADLPDALDRAISSTNLQMHRDRRWWTVVRVCQWALIAVAVVGLGWLAADGALVWFQLPPLPPVRWWGLPAPTVLVAGAVVCGLVLGGISRIGVEVGARRKVNTARRALLGKIDTEVRDLVVAPVTAELARYATARDNLATILAAPVVGHEAPAGRMRRGLARR